MGLLVGDVVVTSRWRFLNNVFALVLDLGWGSEVSIILLVITSVLNNGVVWHASLRCIGWCFTEEEGRTSPDIPKLESIILLQDLAVDVWDEEEGGEDEKTESNTKSDAGNEPSWLLVKTEIWGSLVDDGERANGSCNQEEEWRSENGILERILSCVDSLHGVSELSQI